jgi:hypothetical protein
MRLFSKLKWPGNTNALKNLFIKEGAKTFTSSLIPNRGLNSRRFIVGSAAILLIGFWVFNISYTKTDNIPKKSGMQAATQVDKCAQDKTVTYSCYKRQLTQITNEKGPQAAIDLLKSQYSQSSYVKSQCHQLVHVVGRAALTKYGNIADTYAHGDQFCWSGYYHGALEQLANQKGVAYLLSNANDICAKVPGRQTKSFYYYNCVHGMGHGYMFVENGNLFKALADCDALIDNFDSTSCYGGVFMQNIMNEQAPDAEEDVAGQPQQTALSSDKPMYPCTAVADKYKDQCYLMQTSYALQVESYDFTKVFKLCSSIEQTYVDTCYTSLGRDASGESISDVQKTKENCMLGPTLDARKYCIEGAVKDFISYFHSDGQAKILCASLTPDLKPACIKVANDYYVSF